MVAKGTLMDRIMMLMACTALMGAIGSARCAEKPAPKVRIIAVQMKVDVAMYRNLAVFRNAMDKAMAPAVARKARTVPTLIALPEDVGLGLVLLNHLDLVKDAKTFRDAGTAVGFRYGADVYENSVKHNINQTRALLLTANDKWLRQAYFDTFSYLAKKHGVYLLAGSAPLTKAGTTSVRNISVLFGPDGKILSQTSKVHLIDLEGPEGLDLEPGSINELRVAKTLFGKVGVTVCWDGFFDDVLDRLVDLGADIIIQPSFNPQVWTPEQETDWETGLFTRLKTRPSVLAGVNPMMVGGLYDIICEGRTNIVGASANNGYFGRLKSATEPGVVVVDLPAAVGADR